MLRPAHLALALVLLGKISPAAADDGDVPPLSIYGFARLDYIVDDSRMSDVERPLFVESEPGDVSNGETSLHPRLSRLGLSIDEWRLAGGVEGQGRLEVDFQGGTAPGGGDSDLIQLRHAYFSVSFDHKVEILAGQTWDLISPLFPAADNDTLLWNAGNTGDRRPQVRLVATPIDTVRAGVAFAMPGTADRQDLDGDGRLDGMESGRPMVQLLAEFRHRLIGDQVVRFGVWGHAAKEQLADGTEMSSSSVGAHFLMPTPVGLTVLGEMFGGVNLSDIRGGIGQGVNPTSGDGIHAVGGWLEAAYVLNEHHMLAAGGSFDRAATDDLSDGDRELNSTGYAVYRYRPHRTLQVGLEYLRWVTRYKNAASGAANRFDLHATMFF